MEKMEGGVPTRVSIRSLEEKHKEAKPDVPLDCAQPPSEPWTELERFYEAVRTMVSSGEYDQIASIHGDPTHSFHNLEPQNQAKEGGFFCAHGQTSFTVWHTGYMMQFEKLLQEADKANYGKGDRALPVAPAPAVGQIACPYWAWENDPTPESVKRYDAFPRALSPHWEAMLEVVKKKNKDKGEAEKVLKREYIDLNKLKEGYVAYIGHLAVHSRTGHEFISQFEEFHGEIHGSSGTPMNEVVTSAYDLLFFFHHCNVERFFRAYVNLKKYDADEKEILWVEKEHRDSYEAPQLGRYLYNSHLTPFNKEPVATLTKDLKEKGKEKWRPHDAYLKVGDTWETLGFGYDNIPCLQTLACIHDESNRAGQCKAMDYAGQTHAVIPRLRLTPENSTATFYAFVHKRDDAGAEQFERAFAEFTASEEFRRQHFWGKFKYFGGSWTLFRQDAANCQNCANPVDIKINVTKAIEALDILPSQTKLVMMYGKADMELRRIPCEKEPVPAALDWITTAPTLNWPGKRAFEEAQEQQKKKKEDGGDGEDAKQKEDGGAGEGASVDARPEGWEDKKGRPKHFCIHGYLQGWTAKQMREEIAKALGEWCDAAGADFETIEWAREWEVEGEDNRLIFAFEREGNDPHWQDQKYIGGPVCQLARTIPGKRVEIDGDDHWLRNDENPDPVKHAHSYPLYPVLLHEIGKLLGLAPSSPAGGTRSHVMDHLDGKNSFLELTKLKELTEHDKEAIRKLYAN